MAREFLDDAFGPDGVRVTVAVEPAVERLVRARNAWGSASSLYVISRYIQRRSDQLVQKRLLGDAWAVVVEADSGERNRATRPTRDDAYQRGLAFRAEVESRGVAAIADLR